MASLLSSLGGICHSTGNKGGQKIIKLDISKEIFALSPDQRDGGSQRNSGFHLSNILFLEHPRPGGKPGNINESQLKFAEIEAPHPSPPPEGDKKKISQIDATKFLKFKPFERDN